MKVRDLVENINLFKSIDIHNAREFYDSYAEYLVETKKKDWILKFLDYEITEITVEKPDAYNWGGGTWIRIKKPDQPDGKE